VRRQLRWSRTIVPATVCAATLAAAGCGSQQHAPAAPVPKPSVVTSGSRPDATPGVRFANVALEIPAVNSGGTLTAGRTLMLPRGWSAEVWARVPGARLEAWTAGGDLLVSEPSNGVIVELIPHSRRSAPPTQRTLLSGLNSPQGMAFDKLDGHEVLYVAEANEVDRYAWSGGRPHARTVIAPNLPFTGPAGSDVHALKNVVVGRDHEVYVDIGSESNASPQSPSTPPRASVVGYRPNGTHMRVIATGVRNGDGLSIAPDGTLWSAINERDQIAYPFHRSYDGTADAYGQVITAYVNNHPPDEIAAMTPGRDVGWPYCNPDPDVDPGRAGTRYDYADVPFDADAQTNPGGTRLDCAKLQPIERGLPAHSAPLGFHFLEGSSLPAPWSDGAVVAVHGSWDRSPPRPPAILWMPWEPKQHTLGDPTAIVGGFQEANGNRWGRTVDAVPGPDGALYVSDDLAGAIYRIVPTKGY
jgi:glucose/arabinose dehydrogenase